MVMDFLLNVPVIVKVPCSLALMLVLNRIF